MRKPVYVEVGSHIAGGVTYRSVSEPSDDKLISNIKPGLGYAAPRGRRAVPRLAMSDVEQTEQE